MIEIILVKIFEFTGIFSDLFLFVGHRGPKSQNKMDFLEFCTYMSYTRQHCCKLTYSWLYQILINNTMLIIVTLCYRIFQFWC